MIVKKATTVADKEPIAIADVAPNKKDGGAEEGCGLTLLDERLQEALASGDTAARVALVFRAREANDDQVERLDAANPLRQQKFIHARAARSSRRRKKEREKHTRSKHKDSVTRFETMRAEQGVEQVVDVDALPDVTGAEAIRDVCAKRGVPGDVEGTILDTLYAFANAVKDESATDYRAFGGGHACKQKC